jgi:hypothetical protein
MKIGTALSRPGPWQTPNRTRRSPSASNYPVGLWVDPWPRPIDRRACRTARPTAAILLRWPQKPSIATPDAYANVAAAAMQVLAAAVIELGALKRGGGCRCQC